MDDGYEVIGDEPPKKAKPVVARPVAKPKPPADDGYEVVEPPAADRGHGLRAEPPAKRPKAHLGYRRKSEVFEDDQLDVPYELRVKKPKKHTPPTADERWQSQVFGACVLVLGTGMCGGGFLGRSAPGAALGLVGGCGFGVIWLGLGLVLFPVPAQALRAIRDRAPYDELFRQLPPVWKWWFWLTFAWLAAGLLLPRLLRS